MLLNIEMFSRHVEVWYSNNNQSQPIGSVGGLPVKEEGCIDNINVIVSKSI